MILGISGSSRANGTTSDVIKYILEQSGQEYEYVSLAGKKINGCIGCTRCAADSFCKVEDDWQEIGRKMNYRGFFVIYFLKLLLEIRKINM